MPYDHKATTESDVLDREGEWDIRVTIYRNGRKVATCDTAGHETFGQAAYWVGEGLNTREVQPHTPKRRTAIPPAAHDCESCEDCIHDGHKCCGCYDGVCCRDVVTPPADVCSECGQTGQCAACYLMESQGLTPPSANRNSPARGAS